jgi:hypothetical protein
MSRVTGGLFLAGLLLAFLLSPPAAKAVTLLFNDLSETPTVSGIVFPLVTCTSPGSEAFTCDISSPAGTAMADLSLDIFNPPNISDPGGITISDEFKFPVFTTSLLTVSFSSDSSESPLGLCASVTVGCQFTETGGVQTLGTVKWFAADDVTVLRTDTIEFASDITDVPEPASWLLVLTGLPLVGLRRFLWRS